MPGWSVTDRWHNNIAYAPALIALHRICEKHAVGDQFRIHHDLLRTRIPMGQDSRFDISDLAWIRATAFLIGGFHVKGQVVDARGVSAWGYGGQTMCSAATGSAISHRAGRATTRRMPRRSGDGPVRTRACPARRRARSARRTCKIASVDWLDHQLAARELPSSDPADTYLVVEHEYPKACIQGPAAARPDPGWPRSRPVRAIDAAAAAMYSLQHEVLGGQGIPVQGIGRQPYRS